MGLQSPGPVTYYLECMSHHLSSTDFGTVAQNYRGIVHLGDGVPAAAVQHEEENFLGQFIGARAMRDLQLNGKEVDESICIKGQPIPIRWFITRGYLHEVLVVAHEQNKIIVDQNRVSNFVKRLILDNAALDGEPDFRSSRNLFEQQALNCANVREYEVTIDIAEEIGHMPVQADDWDLLDEAIVIELIGETVDNSLRDALEKDTKSDGPNLLRLIADHDETDQAQPSREEMEAFIADDTQVKRCEFVQTARAAIIEQLIHMVAHGLQKDGVLEFSLRALKNDVRKKIVEKM